MLRKLLFQIYGKLLRKEVAYEKVTSAKNHGPFSTSVVIRKTAADEKSSELLKQATRYKSEGDWNRAIQSLRDAYALMGDELAVYPIETALRLPLYLQQAGRHEESLKEFDALLNRTDHMAAIAFSHQPKSKQKDIARRNREKIKDKMDLAMRRELKKTSRAQ